MSRETLGQFELMALLAPPILPPTSSSNSRPTRCRST